MCPPMLCSTRFARTTMARAFQRIRLLMRRSSSWSPGKSGSRRGGMVLAYGVFAVNGRSIPLTVACARRRSRISAATSGPLDSRTESSDSSHSWISTSSMPCGWVDNSLSMTSLCSSSLDFQCAHNQRGGFKSQPAELGYTAARFSARRYASFLEKPRKNLICYRSHRPAAIDNQHLPGDEFRTDEKHHGVGNVRRPARAAQRRPPDEIALPLGRITVHGDRSGSDGIHAHFRCQFFRKTARQQDDPGFRNAMRDVARPAQQAADVRKVDDDAVALLEERRSRLRAEKWRFQVGVQGRIPQLLGRRFEFRVEKIGGVVDKNIQPAELLRGFLEEPPDVINLREIRREGRAAPPQFLHFRNGAPRFRNRGPVMNRSEEHT